MKVARAGSKRRNRNKIVLAAIFIGLFWTWYSVAADYGYRAVAGTYTFERGTERSILILHRDQSFEQELSRAGSIRRTRGRWRRVGEGGVAFSKDLLTVAGQSVAPDG